jgi:hypothetical protein
MPASKGAAAAATAAVAGAAVPIVEEEEALEVRVVGVGVSGRMEAKPTRRIIY